MTLAEATVEFGKLVRAIRKEKKLKSSKLAEQVDIEVKHLGRIERGEKRPSFELIVGLADALGVSPARFFAFESETRDPKLLKKRILRQVAGRDLAELSKAAQILEILFSSPGR
jgi:transcriptional regulator with XRE-family HTH domain